MYLLNSKCDSTGCTRESTLFRVFQGCGHSFHVECNLPDVSVCKICKAFLKERIAKLNVTANKAVKEFDADDDEGESDDEGEEIEDDDENDGLFDEWPTCEGTVARLVAEINAWRRLEGPQS